MNVNVNKINVKYLMMAYLQRVRKFWGLWTKKGQVVFFSHGGIF